VFLVILVSVLVPQLQVKKKTHVRAVLVTYLTGMRDMAFYFNFPYIFPPLQARPARNTMIDFTERIKV
jgi:hypothetical protein